MNKIIENRKFFMRIRNEDSSFSKYAVLPMEEIDKHIRRKSKDIGFWFNQLKEGYDSHKMSNFDIPCFTWVDIDFHDEESKKEFSKDVGMKFGSIEKFFSELKKDKYFFIIGQTQGGGIRIVSVYDYVYEEFGDTDMDLYKEYVESKQKEIYQIITNRFIKYVCKYGLRQNASYMDRCSTKLSQPSFGLRDNKYFHINKKCQSFEYEIKIGELETTETKRIELTDVEKLDLCKNNSELTRQIYEKRFVGIENLFTTHNPALIAIVRYCDSDAIGKWYEMYKQYYSGKSFLRFLTSFETFKGYLEISKSLTNPGSLYYFIKNNM